MDDVGMALLHALRRGDPHADDLAAAPAHLFGSDDVVLARAAATLPRFFQWDADLVPADGSLLYFISHDGYVNIQARTMDVYLRELERYRIRRLGDRATGALTGLLPAGSVATVVLAGRGAECYCD